MYGDMKILTGTANPKLAQDICEHLGCHLTNVLTSEFSDGELRVEIIDRAVEKTLNLSRVQINGDNALGACDTDKIRNKLCTDRSPGANLPILASVAKIRNNSGDATCAGALQCVKHKA